MAIRIVDGVAYEVKRTGPFRLRAHDLGNGHLEISGQRDSVARELDWSPRVISDHLEMLENYRELHADELREKSITIAANKAKTRVRKLCKSMGADTLLTLTYKLDQTDLDLCKRHLKEFVRRVTRVLPDFGAVAAFETQKRGTWHVHLGTCRIPRVFTKTTWPKGSHLPQMVRVKSYDLLRQIWRDVTKAHGGNVDVARSKSKDRSPARIAAYLAKYISKGYAEGEKWSNRWTKFGVSDVPKAIDMGTVDRPLDAISTAFAFLSDGHEVVTHVFSRWGDWLYLAAENLGIKKPTVVG